MNARQRRLQRRLVQPYVQNLIDGLNEVSQLMRKTGKTMTPEDCDGLAESLRYLLQGNPERELIVRRS